MTYDVRGAGESDRPRHRSAYRLAQLADDLRVVLDEVSPDQPVHLLAHDWGSVTDPWFVQRLASYTSISGPSLDMVGVWMRRARRHPRPVLRQLLDSYYVALFQLPWHRSSGQAARRHHRRHPALPGQLRSTSCAPYPRATSVPVQVLAPSLDAISLATPEPVRSTR